MKKLILIAIAFIALQATAQEHRNNKERGQRMMTFSADEMATLHTKKMTLHLDLNESQQAQIYKMNLKKAKIRKASMEARKAKMGEHKAKKENGESMEKPSKEERFKMMNKKLDHQIAAKQKMKEILNEEQYAKWGKAQAKRMHKGKARRNAHSKRKDEHKKE